MNPKIASKLAQEVPEIKEFVSFIKQEIRKLDTTTDILLDDPIELAVEVKARKKAIEVLVSIMSPIVNAQDIKPLDINDYSVDVV